MKKLLVLTLMLTMALWAGCAAGEAMVETIIGDYSCRISADNTITIIDYFCKEESVIIPSELDGYPVTGIGDSAFYGADYMTSVTIPDSVTSIGDYAFDECYDLTSIEIPDSVTSIGDYAFENCISSTSIEIPDSVEYIGSNPFRYCKGNIEIHVSPEHPVLATIDGVLFNKTEKKLIRYPRGLTASSYKIPQGISVIGDDAFYDCNALTSIEIPDSVTSIGDFAFDYCDNLTSIEIPDSVEYIGSNPFKNYSVNIEIHVSPEHPVLATIDGVLFNKTEKKLICYPLGLTASSYKIPQGIFAIGDAAFYGCDALTSIEIPDSVTSIGDFAFFYCESLTSITIPDSVTDIGDYAFYSCDALTSIEIPDSVTSIGERAFYNCPSDLVFMVDRDSYAVQWCKEHGFKYNYLDALDWLNN